MKSYHQASGGVKPGLRVLLAGGGSGGSAAPVIAVAEAIRERQPETELLYVGTRTGPEAQLASAAGLPYVGIPTGRFRRYGTWRNLTDPVLVLVGLCRAQAIVHRFGPTLAFGAGGFATVPPLLAARLGRARVGVHQQDVAWGLANRMLAPFASHRTCAFEETCQRLTSTSAISVGNPVRRSILLGDPTVGRAELGLDANRPLVLATGGGTGAARLNDLLVGAAPELLKCWHTATKMGIVLLSSMLPKRASGMQRYGCKKVRREISAS